MSVTELCTPKTKTETVVDILSGPKWDGERWTWTFFAYWWNLSPAYCGKCGNCTNPNNVKPCGHPEAEKHVRGQIFVTSLEQFAHDTLERGHSVRYVRNGKTELTREQPPA